MKTANIHDAKTHLSRLVELATKGEEVIIARFGKPMVKLVPYDEKKDFYRTPGDLKGKIKISDDFDDLDQEVIDSFYHE